MNFIPVVLSGGSGTRLWPLSRTKFPKQFCELLDDSLQTLTLKRLCDYESPLIITSEKMITLTENEIAKNKFSIRKVIYEPQSKNTAAAVALACRYLELCGASDQICGIFSSDALITNESEFKKAIQIAVKAAATGQVVVLGMTPTRIETGFGYIQVSEAKVKQIAPVLKFHEKPNYETALSFVKSGNYFWNAGIFIFKVSQMIQDFKMHQPQMWSIISKLSIDLKNLTEIYSELKNISFDYAIIEKLKSSELSCLPCDLGWSDLGSWDVLSEINEADKKISLNQIPFEIESKNSVVFSREKKTYGFVAADNLIVVDTPDALLICKKGESQKVKQLVDSIKLKNENILTEHDFEIRPWGRFDIIKNEENYKTKLITIEPGQKISYQSHAHRSEHWVIVKGEAVVVLNDQEIPLKAGEHILIPQGAKHRMINQTNNVVEFIEVQVGTYFGEDDIVRYQDDYGR